MERIRILCFGDSNTWGYNPRTRDRFPEEVRWTGILQQALGDRYRVIEEGQNSRTIALDDPCEGEKNGMTHIVPCMESQKPFDLLILMLGTNDMKQKFNLAPLDIFKAMQLMVEKALSCARYHMTAMPRVLLVSPPLVGERIRASRLGASYGYERAIRTSRELGGLYQELARQYGCDFLNAAEFARVGDTDSIHLEEDGHRQLASALLSYVKKQFPA